MHDIELMCHKQGRQLWHFLCPRLFDPPYVPLLCPGHNSKTLWNIFMNYYAPAYSMNSGRALSVTPVRPIRLSVRPSICPSVRPSVRQYVPLSCPGRNSKTLWNIFMKLHRCIHHNKTMCQKQGRQLFRFWFLNYFPLT